MAVIGWSQDPRHLGVQILPNIKSSCNSDLNKIGLLPLPPSFSQIKAQEDGCSVHRSYKETRLLGKEEENK